RGKFLFRDNLSTNGSFVNGQDVDGDVELANFDEITTGQTILRLVKVEP
ncbi:MAG: FHA domain-containing protein, partial [Deltaproteobacteria bacterium]|nr:FHA domain-containing protein [Deltaproteobacteria bacterium]